MKIIISGDSWACGEWGKGSANIGWEKFYNTVKGNSWPKCPLFEDRNLLPDWIQLELANKFNYNLSEIKDYYLLHTGLEQYFTDAGFTVLNLSKGNTSNLTNLNSLANTDIDVNDIIIWFQTEPIRDLRPYHTLENKFETVDQLIIERNNLLYLTYKRLNSLGNKIICIGGCSKLNKILMNKFENLSGQVESFIELLLGENAAPDFWISKNAWQHLFKHITIDNTNTFMYNQLIIQSLKDNKEYFDLDATHPNRNGHKKLFNYLIDHENIFKRT